jgi:UDP-N-acetylmuramate dehydrogenase
MGAFEWFEKNAANFHGELRWNEPLSKHTYYRIGGPTPLMAFPKDVPALRWLREGSEKTGVSSFILGLGSNLLVSDEGFPGLVIKTSRLDISIEAVETSGDTVIVRTGSSVAVSTLLRRAAQEGWSGFECLAGVPGSVGGVVVMNAGTHLGEAQERIHRVGAHIMDSRETREWRRGEMEFEYRRNRFLPEAAIVTWVEWTVRKAEPAIVKKTIDETLERRKATQPVDYPSCGSVFKNPRESGLRAWQVVDSLGLRGHRIGNAQFAEKHSNFIINLGNARAAEVRALIELAQTRAKSELGITLEEEVKFLGRF